MKFYDCPNFNITLLTLCDIMLYAFDEIMVRKINVA